jgi:hypothetical protein
MKKYFAAILVVVTIAIAGCNEKKLLSDVDGSWKMTKYTVDSKDKTTYFDTTFRDYTWFIRPDKTFTEYWKIPSIAITYNYTRVFDSIDNSIPDSIFHTDTTIISTPTFAEQGISGTWVLTNSNKFIQFRDSVNSVREYKIVDHSAKSMHLFKGNEDLYLDLK